MASRVYKSYITFSHSLYFPDDSVARYTSKRTHVECAAKMTQNFVWTHEMIISLIDLYKEKAMLWDTNSEDYKIRSKKSEAWQEIAEALNLDRQTVEKKIRMLVGQYRRELVKEGAGAQSRWFGFTRLRFLGTAQDNASHNNSVSEQVNHEFVDTRSEEGSNLEDGFDTHEDLSRKRTRTSKRHVNEDTSDLVALIREERKSRDESTVFGEHVAFKLRKITNPHAKATTQYLINQILYNAEMGKYDKTDDRNRATSSTGTACPGVNVVQTDPEAVDNIESVVVKLENEIW